MSHYSVFCVYRWCHKLFAVKLISVREIQLLVCEIPASTLTETIHPEMGILRHKSWNYRTEETVMKFYLNLQTIFSIAAYLCIFFLSHFIWYKISLLKMLVHTHNNSYHFLFLCQRTRVMSQYIPIWSFIIFLSCTLIISTALSYQLVNIIQELYQLWHIRVTFG